MSINMAEHTESTITCVVPRLEVFNTDQSTPDETDKSRNEAFDRSCLLH